MKSIVAIGANFHYSAPLSDFEDAFVSEEDQAEYNLISPDAPGTLLEKIIRMNQIWKTEPDISVDDIASIQCPVLVMAGDDDVIKHDHTISLYEALPLGQLAIIPGTSHGLIKEKPNLSVAKYIGRSLTICTQQRPHLKASRPCCQCAPIRRETQAHIGSWPWTWKGCISRNRPRETSL